MLNDIWWIVYIDGMNYAALYKDEDAAKIFQSRTAENFGIRAKVSKVYVTTELPKETKDETNI